MTFMVDLWECSFATTQYNSAFGDLPAHDSAGLRAATLKYLESFDKQLWFDDPMLTVIQGRPYRSGHASFLFTRLCMHGVHVQMYVWRVCASCVCTDT